ncbi:Uncharacterised protein [Legionella beliardensis]|uniref:Chitinase n=2 Tax=Legionella beliardensis TaxID=91822 RepID=A0A378I266_9GAMM|nr:Uncharacterised protein [Legionella beliardensis]
MLRKNKSSHKNNRKRAFPLLILSLSSLNLFASVTDGNGAWVYDTLYNNQGQKIGQSPGLFASQINNFNAAATGDHTITKLYSYGGSLEMYCKGSGGTATNKACNASNMYAYYDNGKLSTAAYYEVLGNGCKPVAIMPVVDGRLDQKGADDYLSALNNLDKKTAALFADKVAKLYCSDENVAGVQFDIEPFDISKPGQAYFYEQIAKDFASDMCIDAKHPKGRTFSIFTFSGKVDSTVARILNTYNNGYVIDSLYDLGSKPGGSVNSPAEYRNYISNEVKRMLDKAKQYNIKFQFAIPAAASAHEFESKGGKSTGFAQLDYVKASYEVFQQYKVQANPNFVGVALWTWLDQMWWGGQRFTPSVPNEQTKAFLANNL